MMPLWTFLAGPNLDGFEQHLLDAIALNTERSAIYGEQTDGASDELFAALISSERLIRPIARLIDAMAVRHVEAGVPVVVGDFVSMEDARPVGAPIKPVAVLDEADQEAADAILAALLEQTASRDHFDIVDASAQALHDLEALEAEQEVYFAMSRHVVESLGYAALHGLYTRCETGGEVDAVVNALVGSQRLGLSWFDVTDYDVQANALHQQGVGVLVNDLPAIPFLAEYEAFAEDRAALERCLR